MDAFSKTPDSTTRPIPEPGAGSRHVQESLETRAIHGGGDPGGESGRPVTPPIVQSSTFHGGLPGDETPLAYTRYGVNPNQVAVGRKMAHLEGMEEGLVTASGMAAISLTLLALVRNGDHLVSSVHLYGATRNFMERELPRRGVEVTFVDPDNPRSWRHALRPETRGLYLEMPTNPMLRVFDPRPVSRLALERGLPLIMDATFATPMNFRAADHGVDVVVHSATKYLGGHSDLIAGVICGPAALIDEVRGLLRLYGPSADPHMAWLLDRGLRTLPVRMARHNENALALAHWFAGSEGVERVIHPFHDDHPDAEIARELLSGGGGMLGVVVEGGEAGAVAFCRALELAAVAPSLGGVETLVSLPAWTSHRTLTGAEREARGIAPGFVRISVGLEGLEDLKRDFRRGLAAVLSGH